MTTAPPAFIDPSQIHLAMPNPLPPAPVPSKSRSLDILKILVGLFIALILAGILIVLVIIPRTSNEIDLRESNENIAKLQRESNENIARLQRESTENLSRLLREQQLEVDKQRLERQENLTETHRFEDRLVELQRREQDLLVAMEQSKQQLQIEERRLQILLEERQLTEQHRKEDFSRENAGLLSDFQQEVISATQLLNITIFQLKVHSLISRLDSYHKSSLISFLYKMKYLSVENPDGITLDLQGANLKDLDLDDMDTNSGQTGIWLNYTQLSLPSTNLINASFEQIYLNESNFNLCNLMGASFRGSQVVGTNFSRAKLSLTNFRDSNASQSYFSSVKMQSASFQNAVLSEAEMSNSDFGSTSFQGSTAVKTKFSQSELSNTDFQYANLYEVQMDYVSARSVNFYNAKAIETNFSHSYLPNGVFHWTDLSSSSFRSAFLAGSSFENANVINVDFTSAIMPGAMITPGQLDVALSIAHAILPDGSTGKNKNLVTNGNAQCTETNGATPGWNNTGDVFTNEDSFSTECAFQARTINATLQQRIDIRRYEQLIQGGQSNVYIEMQEKAVESLNPSDPPVYMNVRFYNSENTETGVEQSSLDAIKFISPSTYVASLPCPSTTVELLVTIIFRQANATVDNIYVTIE